MSAYDKLVQGENRAILLAQSRTIKTLLQDTCNIQPTDLTGRTVSRYGVESGTLPALRQYNGSESIPCRADYQRSFRPDNLDYQATEVDEVDLHLPYDMEVKETDEVILHGDRYNIRKLINDSTWDVTKIAKIMRVTTQGVHE